MRPPAERTRIAVVQPEGWIRLRIDDDLDDRIVELSAVIARSAEPARRDLARAQLRRSLRELADRARSQAYEVWIPVGSTGGVLIPVTMTVGPLPSQPDPSRPVSEVLLALASAWPGARAVDVGARRRRGRLARHSHDERHPRRAGCRRRLHILPPPSCPPHREPGTGRRVARIPRRDHRP